ncbi:RHS repeat-associated core domain-containing protein [Actinokineospora sp. HUAS TT18]|uniref:RHS repeat-associated core domain-containing protein n=1 Tax=Actinokineospora sp. HUAS TT18 TaxID=3447451 RepID=UPI003F51C0D2
MIGAGALFAGGSGVYGANGTQYRTETNSAVRVRSTVPSGQDAQGPSGFVVELPDGRRREFSARTVSRRVEDVFRESNAWQDNVVSSTEVRAAWLMDSEVDKSGNRVSYEYGDATDGWPVTKISYTKHDQDQEGNNGLAAQRRVEFGYESRPDPVQAYAGGVHLDMDVRLKSVSMFAPNPGATELVWRYDLGYEVSPSGRSRLVSVAKCSPSGKCLRSKRFGWDGQRSAVPAFGSVSLGAMPLQTGLAKKPAMRVSDVNNDGADDVLVTAGGHTDLDSPDAVTLGHRDSATGAVSPLADYSQLSGYGAWPANADISGIRVMDADGDGIADVMAPSGSQDAVLRWNAVTGQFVSTGTTVSSQGATVFADMDGDGRMDFLPIESPDQQTPAGYSVRVNQGGSFAAPKYSSFTSCGLRVTDLDGDGRSDLVGYTPDVSSVDGEVCSTTDVRRMRLGTDGNTHESDMSYKTGLPLGSGPTHYKALPWQNNTRSVLGDFNGDGLEDDLLVPTDPAKPAEMFFGTGNGIVHQSSVSVPHDAHVDLRVADVNTDGADDLVSFTDTATTVLISTRFGGFHSQVIASDGGTKDTNGRATSQLGDFDGDGQVDVVRVSNGTLRLSTLSEPVGDRIVNVWDDNDQFTKVTVGYGQSWTDHPERMGDYACSYPMVCPKRGRTVARSVTTQATPASAPYRVEYSFEDPVLDVRGRGWLGFGTVRTWDRQRPQETVTTFAHRTQVDGKYYPFTDLPSTSMTVTPILTLAQVAAQPGSVGLARVVHTQHTGNTVWHPENMPDVYMAAGLNEHTNEWEQPVTMTWGSLVGTTATTHVSGINVGAQPLRRMDGTRQIDDYGNVTASLQFTVGGASVSSTAVFAHTQNSVWKDRWLMQLPTHTTTTATEASAPLNNPSTRTRTADYDYDDLGRMTAGYTEKAPAGQDPDPGLRETATVDYDVFGVAVKATLKAPGRPDRVTHTEYDTVFAGQPDEGVYPSQVWQEHSVAAHRPSTWTATHPALGVALATQDVNGVQTTSSYDEFGRLTSALAEGSTAPVTTTYTNPPCGGCDTSGTIVSIKTGASVFAPVTTTVTDASGRTVSTAATPFTAQPGQPDPATTTTYDVLGRVASTTSPAPGGTTTTSYDSLDRVLSVTNPVGKSTTHAHTFTTTITTGPTGDQSTTTVDTDRRVASVTGRADLLDPNTAVTTTYDYAPFGQIDTITDSAGHRTRYTYDLRGRTISTTDPDHGTTTATYHGTGAVNTTTHVESGRVTSYGYDDLGRTTSRTVTGGTAGENGTAYWVFDTAAHGIGKLDYSDSPDGIRVAQRYDIHGRGVGTDYTDKTLNQTYSVDQTFTATGRPDTVTYPEHFNNTGRYTTSNTYQNGDGYLSRVSDATNPDQPTPLATTQTRNPNGSLATTQLGNGLTITNTYDTGTARLHNITVTNPATTHLQNLTYDYNDDGSLQRRTDTVDNRIDNYYYDHVGRLTNWELYQNNSNQKSRRYHYDTIGNLTQVDHSGVPTETRAFGGPNNTRPHILTGIGIALGGGQSVTEPLTWDNHGRQTSGNGRTNMTYTAFDLPKTVTRDGNTTTYRYTADGTKARETTTGPTGTTSTFYIPGVFERRTTTNGATDIYHLTGPDGPIGQAVYNGTTTTVEYTLPDQQGSTTTVTDNTGTITQKLFYDPWGAQTTTQGDPTPTNTGDVTRRYTGHETDTATALINMGGRVYDPTQKIVLTPDPLNTPAHNPYAYTDNNPANRIDPSGYTWCAPVNHSCDDAGGTGGGTGNPDFDEFLGAANAYHTGGAQGLHNWTTGHIGRDADRWESNLMEWLANQPQKSDNTTTNDYGQVTNDGLQTAIDQASKKEAALLAAATANAPGFNDPNAGWSGDYDPLLGAAGCHPMHGCGKLGAQAQQDMNNPVAQEAAGTTMSRGLPLVALCIADVVACGLVAAQMIDDALGLTPPDNARIGIVNAVPELRGGGMDARFEMLKESRKTARRNMQVWEPIVESNLQLAANTETVMNTARTAWEKAILSNSGQTASATENYRRALQDHIVARQLYEASLAELAKAKLRYDTLGRAIDGYKHPTE